MGSPTPATIGESRSTQAGRIAYPRPRAASGACVQPLGCWGATHNMSSPGRLPRGGRRRVDEQHGSPPRPHIIMPVHFGCATYPPPPPAPPPPPRGERLRNSSNDRNETATDLSLPPPRSGRRGFPLPLAPQFQIRYSLSVVFFAGY